MNTIILESNRLFLIPLLLNELMQIENNEADIEGRIGSEAISDFVRIAISKKIEKMKHVSEETHEWLTYWLIIDRDSGLGIGFAGFKGLPDESGHTEVGYSISPGYRKRGLMTEALNTLTDWARESKSCKGLTAKVLKTNMGSIKVLNNCGFKLAASAGQEDCYTLEFS